MKPTMRSSALGLVVGAAIGGVVALQCPAEPRAPMRVGIPFPVPTRIDQRSTPSPSPSPPPPPAPPVHASCSKTPQHIGQPLAKLPTDEPTDIGYWHVEAAAGQCVIAAWTGATIVASWDDGATFAPVLESSSPIVGAAVRDDGTIFVMREDFTLGVAHPDGSSISRSLTFGGEPFTRGRWLVIRTKTSPAISDDEGASWRQLDWGEGYLADLHILDDGAIVAFVDLRMEVCGHQGCDGPTEKYIETQLDGRPWRPASPRHVRAASIVRKVLAVPPKRGGIDPHAVLDSHRLLLEVAAHRYLVRYTPAGWRLLFTGAS